ncbi:aromatic amino acid lyase [Streptomyces jumonjinensis]|uniref:Tyrosine 2,3-aminomutase n=1 Tax=Streptomyces jumonjinensis TaxID=1945 RepID=A0A646KRL3_STRJU|nr:aromatic amino acid lyase [Streptomyces jumonjinensis]MQT04718.1 tyrosine 2,3-aminomutase [Streptomyces jumonjinensis]
MSVFETEVASVVVDGRSLTVGALRSVAEHSTGVSLSGEAVSGARRGRRALEELLRANPVEGVTAFFDGTRLARVGAALECAYQTNLIRAHSTGVGPLFAGDETRAILTALLNSLAKGYSAVRPEVLERLAHYLNHGVTPAVPELGSLGAAGDMVPLAHIASTLIGEGQVVRDGRRMETSRLLGDLGVRPLRLRFKEGRALIGGVSAMTGLGSLIAARALDQVRQAEIAAAVLTGAVGGSAAPFRATGHDLARPHRGQIDTAANLRELLRDGSAALAGGGWPQPPEAYPLRAVPQVLGAVRHTLYQTVDTLETELNSASDDPLFFGGREVFHGANGQGQPVAFAMDFATIALVQLGTLAERQLDGVLTSGAAGGLSRFLLAADPVLHHGFAAARYPALALAAENRTIGPASTQSVATGDDRLGIASMGMVAVRNARRVLENNNRILAVLFLAAAQAVDLSRRFDELGPAAQAAYDAVRSLVPPLGVDRAMAGDIELMTTALSRGEVLRAVSRYAAVALR